MNMNKNGAGISPCKLLFYKKHNINLSGVQIPRDLQWDIYFIFI